MELYTDANKIIDAFCEITAKDLLKRSKEPGGDVWPRPVFAPSEGVYFAHEPIFSDMHILFKLFEQNGLTSRQVANLFMYPSRAAHLMYLLLEKPHSKQESCSRTQVVRKWLECINILRNGNLFCGDGRNTVWSHEKITKILHYSIIKEVNNLPNSEMIKDLISKTIVALSWYCELLYFANLAFGREYHGPYDVKGLGQLLVREFYDLKPPFWEFTQEFPFTEVKFLTIYQSSDIQFDFAGRIYTSQSLGPRLSSVYIQIDNKPIPIEPVVLEQTLKMIQITINKALMKIKTMTKVQLMTRFVESFFWVLKPLKERVNLSWQPPQEVYRRIQEEQPNPYHLRILKTLKNYTEDECFRIMKMLIDPRVSYDEVRQLIRGLDETKS